MTTTLTGSSGLIVGNGGSTGTVVLNGGTGPYNSYTGNTIIQSGSTLSVDKLDIGGNNSGIGSSSALATSLIINGGTLQYTGSGDSTDRLFTIGGTGATLVASGTGNLTFSSTGSISIPGSTPVTLTLGGSDPTTFNPLIGDPTGGGGTTSVVKNGGGTWILTANNTYSGGTAANAGVLQGNPTTATSTPFGTGDLTIAFGGTLYLIGTATATNTTNGNLIIGNQGGVLTVDATAGGATTLSLSGSLSRAPTTAGTLNIIPFTGSLGTNEIINFTTNTPATIITSQPTSPLVPVYVVAQASGNSTLGTAGTYLTQGATGGLVPLTYSAQTNINMAGAADVFDAGSNQTVNSALNLLALRVGTGVTVDVNGNPLTIGSGSGTSGVLLNGGLVVDKLGGGSLAFGAAEAVIYAGTGTTSTISATIGGSGGLTVFGSKPIGNSVAQGTLAISSDNSATLSGAVNINHVMLLAENLQNVGLNSSATGTGAVNVNSGGTLGGGNGNGTASTSNSPSVTPAATPIGFIDGPVNVKAGGTIAPGIGSSFGILTINGNTTFNVSLSSATLAIKLTANSNDVLMLSSGNLNFLSSNGVKTNLEPEQPRHVGVQSGDDLHLHHRPGQRHRGDPDQRRHVRSDAVPDHVQFRCGQRHIQSQPGRPDAPAELHHRLSSRAVAAPAAERAGHGRRAPPAAPQPSESLTGRDSPSRKRGRWFRSGIESLTIFHFLLALLALPV